MTSMPIIQSIILQVNMWYSGYNWSFPAGIKYLEFIPKRPTDKNVSPYGQSARKPIFNFTTENYGGRNMNLTILLNETYSCVNISLSTDSAKANSTLLGNATWLQIGSNMSIENNAVVWLWADYDCNRTDTGWAFWEPNIFFRGCCYGCICDEDYE